MVSVLALVALGVVAVNRGPTDARARARAWVAAHRNALPTTLGEIAAFPAAYRPEIMNALSPEVKSKVWREQFQYALDHETLTARQRAFLELASSEATPANLAPNAIGANVCSQSKAAFGDNDFALGKRLSQLGEEAQATPTLRSRIVSLTEAIDARLVLKAADNCTCAGMGWCACNLTVSCVQEACNPVPCECFWNDYTCDSVCDKTAPNLPILGGGN